MKSTETSRSVGVLVLVRAAIPSLVFEARKLVVLMKVSSQLGVVKPADSWCLCAGTCMEKLWESGVPQTC